LVEREAIGYGVSDGHLARIRLACTVKDADAERFGEVVETGSVQEFLGRISRFIGIADAG
jgi:hypothetical protein